MKWKRKYETWSHRRVYRIINKIKTIHNPIPYRYLLLSENRDNATCIYPFTISWIARRPSIAVYKLVLESESHSSQRRMQFSYNEYFQFFLITIHYSSFYGTFFPYDCEDNVSLSNERNNDWKTTMFSFRSHQ